MTLSASHLVASFRHILYTEMHIFEEASEMFGSHLHHRTPDALYVTQRIVLMNGIGETTLTNLVFGCEIPSSTQDTDVF